MSAKKRRPNDGLDQNNWTDTVNGGNGTEMEADGFPKANPEVLDRRRIVRALKSPAGSTQSSSNNNSSNPFSGILLSNGGAKAPPLPATGGNAIPAASVPPTASVEPVKLQEAWQKLVPKMNACNGNLSALFSFLQKHVGDPPAKIELPSPEKPSTATTTSSPPAPTPPAPAAAPTTGFSFTSPAPAPAAPTTEFSFTAPAPAAPMFSSGPPSTFAPAASPSADPNDTGAMLDDTKGGGFVDVPDQGWKRILTVQSCRAFQFKNNQYQALGKGILKLQQDETDATKFALLCGTNTVHFFNSFLTDKANPQWGEKELKPGTKFRSIVLTLTDDTLSAHLYRLKLSVAEATKLMSKLQEVVGKLQK